MNMIKKLPSNLQVEEDLVGYLIKDSKRIIDVIDILKPSDFYGVLSRTLYESICKMYKKDIPIDLTTVLENIGVEKIKSIGGITKVSQIVSQAFGSNVQAYAKIIKKLSTKRQIIISCTKAIEEAYTEQQEPIGIINKLESSFIDTGIDKEGTYTIGEVLLDTVNTVEANFRNGGKITGVSTGYKKLDNAINGLVKKDLIILAARPSMGKTAMMLNIAKNIDRQNKVAIFELEMSKEKLGNRLLSAKTAIDSKNLSRGKIKEGDFERILAASSNYEAKNNIFINTNSSMSILDIKTECKRLKLKYGLDVIFIDHLGYLKPITPNAPRVQQVGDITKQAKAIAKELDVCVVLLSQLSRAVEQRQDKHPQLSDLRDSGNIEEDTDTVLFLYRDDYYAEREQRESQKPGVVQVAVAKNRDGEAGWLDLNFLGEYQLIVEEDI